jgi:hypothetical protein
MEPTTDDPTAYLASLPPGRREEMTELDQRISKAMTGHSRVLWKGVFWGGTEQTIIGYGDLQTTGSKGKVVDWFMVGLALQKNHISVYVNAVRDGRYLAEAYADRLGKVKVGRASIALKRLEDLDLEAFTEVLEGAREQMDTK